MFHALLVLVLGFTLGPAVQAAEPEQDPELAYVYQLAPGIRDSLPGVWWVDNATYNNWLRALPKEPTAPRTLFGRVYSQGYDQEFVSKYINDQAEDSCHFYSAISPSVKSGRVEQDIENRTLIVRSQKDFLYKCKLLKRNIGDDKCTAVEFAGHSTQSVGLDTIFGIDRGFRKGKGVYGESFKDQNSEDAEQTKNEVGDEVVYIPSKKGLEEIGECLRDIIMPARDAHGKDIDPVIVISSCGGDIISEKGAPDDGKRVFWRAKKEATDELAKIFKLRVLTGRGPVTGWHEGGSYSVRGWYGVDPKHLNVKGQALR